MKKKLVCLTLSILMLLSVFMTGCNTTTEDDGTDEGVDNSAKTIVMWVPTKAETSQRAQELVAEEFTKITKAAYKINVVLKFVDEEHYYEELEKSINALQDEVLLKAQCEKELKAYKKAHKEDKNANGTKKSTKELEAEFYAENPDYQKFQTVEEDEDEEESATEEETVINDYGIAEIKYPDVKENQVDIFYIGGFERYMDYYQKEWLASLDEELASGSRKLNSYISPTLLNGVRVDGGVYAIPNNVKIGDYTYMMIDRELFDKYYNKIDDVTTVLDLATFLSDMKSENELRKSEGNTEEIVPLASSFEECMRMLVWYWNLDYVDYSVYKTYYDAETGRNYVTMRSYTTKTTETQGEGENAKEVEVVKTKYVNTVQANLLYKTNENGQFVDKDGNVLDYKYAYDEEGAWLENAKGLAAKTAEGATDSAGKLKEKLVGMYLVDGDGMPVLPEDDKRVIIGCAYEQEVQLDENGKQMKDDNGNLVYGDKLDADGMPIEVTKFEGRDVIWDDDVATGVDADGQPKPSYYYTYAEDADFSILGSLKINPATRSRGSVNYDFNSLFTQAEYRELYATLMGYSYNGYFGEAGEGKRAAVSFMKGDSTIKLAAEENNNIYTVDGKEYYVVVAEYPEASEQELYGNMFAVYGSSNYVSKSMEVLTRLNTNQELRDLLQYGILGQHYELNEDGTAKLLSSSEADYGVYRMDIEKTGNCFICTPPEAKGPDAWTYAKMQNNDSLINPLLGFDFNTEMKESDTGLDVALMIEIQKLNKEAQALVAECGSVTELEELIGGDDPNSFKKIYASSAGNVKLTKATNGAYDPEQPAGPEVPNQTADTSGQSPYTIYKNWLNNYGYAATAATADAAATK